MTDTLLLRAASKANKDTLALAHLVDIAGEGIPRLVWADLRLGTEPIYVTGQRRAARDEGAFSWRNAILAEEEGGILGAMVGYRLASEIEPADLLSLPPLFRPLQALEERAAGTFYINVLGVYEHGRNRGVGAALLEAARDRARALGLARLSLIAQDANPALRLYTRAGFREAARLPIVEAGGWRSPGKNWCLMRAET